MMKRLFCILLSLMLLAAAPFVLAEDAAAETEGLAVELAPVLLATVNGEEIMSDNLSLMDALSYYKQLAQSYGMDITDESTLNLLQQYSMQHAIQTTLIFQKAKELGLDTITDEDKAKITEEGKASWEEIIQNLIADQGTVTDESSEDDKAAARADALAALAAYGYDDERYLSEYIESEINNTLYDRVKNTVAGDITVSDEDVQKYYEDLVNEDKESYEGQVESYEYMTKLYGQSSYYTPEGYRAVTHILLPVEEGLLNTWSDLSARLEEQKTAEEAEPTEAEEPAEAEAPAAEEAPADAETPAGTEEETPAPEAETEPEPTAEPVTQEMVDAAEKAILESVQATVDEIMAKLESGTPFEDLIKEYGSDPGMESEEQRAAGYPVHNNSIVYDSRFKDAAMALEKIGDISKPVVSQLGVHILQYLKDIPAGAAELTDEMKESFRSTILEEQQNEAFQSAIDEWMAAAAIEYTADGEAWKLVPQEEAEEEAAAPEAEETAEAAPEAAEETEAAPEEAPAE